MLEDIINLWRLRLRKWKISNPSANIDRPPKKPPNTTTVDQTTQDEARRAKGLCERCKKIYLDQMLSGNLYTWEIVRDTSKSSAWKVDSCALCIVFRSTLSDIFEDALFNISITKLSGKGNNYHLMDWCSIDTVMLQIRSSRTWSFGDRCIILQPDGIQGPVQMIEKNITSYAAAKEWIDFCRKAHVDICTNESSSTVRYQRLIDCQTRTLVPAEDHPYVALSYVWGPTHEVIHDSRVLPTELPRTIEDALTVTQKLDYRYLWQETEKTYQIGKMDQIYSNAELTIIAAAGDGPNYGLPGVGHRLRTSPHLTTSAKIGKHFLITTACDPRNAILNTKWATRGWTFQEALLSRRRLVFTEEQMYFECYGMACCESLKCTLGDEPQKHNLDQDNDPSFHRAFPKGVGTSRFDIVKRIGEYTERSLSNPNDILNGVLGILHAFERSTDLSMRVTHCLGIPILPPMDVENQQVVPGWTPTMGFFIGLCWEPTGYVRQIERRSGFPSWCWTGWMVTVNWDVFGRPTLIVDSNVKFSVECTDGQILSWEEFQKENDNGDKAQTQRKMSGIIRITAWIIDFSINSQLQLLPRHWFKTDYSTVLSLEDGGHRNWRFSSDSCDLFETPGQECAGILIGRNPKLGPEAWIILVLVRRGELYERIALAMIDLQGKFPLDSHGDPIPQELSKSWREIRIG